ncbi:MAG: hypothetical protein IJY99_04250 [Alphaproteobacteria bacterium]|nr:hypothetical protein [Alphaproteobacteria bacterium]
MKNDYGVRCISICEKMGYETPNAMSVQASRAAADRARTDLRATLERMLRERAELAKDPKTSPEYLAKYDRIINDIRGTLTGSTAKKYRTR